MYSRLNLSKEWFIMNAVVAVELENLKVEQKKAKQEATEQKAAVERAEVRIGAPQTQERLKL